AWSIDLAIQRIAPDWRSDLDGGTACKPALECRAGRAARFVVRSLGRGDGAAALRKLVFLLGRRQPKRRSRRRAGRVRIRAGLIDRAKEGAQAVIVALRD